MQPNLYAVTVDLILIAVFALTVYRAWKRGFVNAVAGLLSVVGAVLAAHMFSFILDGYLQRTVFDPLITDIVGTAVTEAVNAAAAAAETAADTAAQALAASLDGIRSWADTLGIPVSLDAASLSSRFSGEIDGEAVTRVTADISAPIAEVLSQWAAYLILFVIAYAVLRCVFWVLDLVMHLPLLHEANSTLGCVCGVLLGAGYAFVAARLLSLVLGILVSRGTLPPEVTSGTVFGVLNGL